MYKTKLRFRVKVAIVSLATEGILILIGYVGFHWLGGGNLFELLVPKTPLINSLVPGVAAGIGATLIVTLGYSRIVPLRLALDNSVLAVFKRMSASSLIIVSLISALGEELLFRGMIQTIAGIAAGSILFAVMHFGFQKKMWAFGLVALLLGLIFGYAYIYSGELISAVIAHALYNLLISAVILLGFFGNKTSR